MSTPSKNATGGMCACAKARATTGTALVKHYALRYAFPTNLKFVGDPNGRRTKREGERIVRAKRDKNSPISIGHERAKWTTATDGVKYPKNTPADESYLDEQPSYASNEVAINWNVTLFALSAGIDALQ